MGTLVGPVIGELFRKPKNSRIGPITPKLQFLEDRSSEHTFDDDSDIQGIDQSCLGFLVKFETKIDPKTMICAKSFFASNFCGFEYFYFGFFL